jgi:riboflavin kinase
LNGTVHSGRGEASKLVNLPWVRRQMRDQLGFSPYPGTLNVRLTEGGIRARRSLLRAGGMEISPGPGYCPGKLFRARLMNLECAVIVPRVSSYPKDIIELVSSINLRKRLRLLDGTSCEVEVTV